MNEVFNMRSALEQDIEATPEVIKQALSVCTQNDRLKFNSVKLSKGYLQGLSMIIITGAGSSYRAGSACAYNTELLCDIPTIAIHSQLLMNASGVPSKSTLVIAVSSSGEDNDTVFAAKRALRNGARVLAVAPNESTLAKMCKGCIELSDCADNLCAFEEEYFLLSLLSIYIGGKIGYMPKLNISVTLKLAEMLSGKLSFSLHGRRALEEAAEYMSSFSEIVFCGYATDEAIAQETSEKFRLFTEKSAYALPIYDVDNPPENSENTLIVPIISNNANAGLIASELNRIKSEYANTLIFTTESIAQECEIRDATVTVEDSIPLFNPIIITGALMKSLSSFQTDSE